MRSSHKNEKLRTFLPKLLIVQLFECATVGGTDMAKSEWEKMSISDATAERLSRAETRLALKDLIVLTRDPEYLAGTKLDKKAAAEHLVRHLRGIWLISKGAGLERISSLIEPAYFEAFHEANSMERPTSKNTN
jgi:hypothetical protein